MSDSEDKGSPESHNALEQEQALQAGFPKNEHVSASLVDINESPAFHVLEEMVKDKSLSQERAMEMKNRYGKLHQHLLDVYESEKSLLRKARKLNSELQMQKVELEKSGTSSYDDTSEIGNLRRELLRAQNTFDISEEKLTGLQQQVEECQSVKSELEKDIEALKKEQTDMIQPHVNQMKKNIEEIKLDISQRKQQIKKLKQDRVEKREQLTEAFVSKEEMIKDNQAQKDILAQTSSLPSRIVKQTDTLITANRHLEIEIRKQNQVSHQLNIDIEAKRKIFVDYEERSRDLSYKYEKQRLQTETKEMHSEKLIKDVDIQKEKVSNLNADKTAIELKMTQLSIDGHRAHEVLLRKIREKDNVIKQLGRGQIQLNHLLDFIPHLQRRHTDLELETKEAVRYRQTQKKQLKEIRSEVQDVTKDMLKMSDITAEIKAEIEESLAVNRGLEKELAELQSEEHELNRTVSQRSIEREQKSREHARTVSKVRKALQNLKVKDLTILDNNKKTTELQIRLREFAGMYDVVKNERNKYVNLCQASTQRSAEMKDKIKILTNEREILKKEAFNKEKALTKQKAEFANAFAMRDGSRNDLNKAILQYSQKRDKIDQQLGNIEKLNSIIDRAETTMVNLRAKYEKGVTDRNFTGMQLIDRNDELCLIYEKLNVQGNLLKNGDMELLAREEEIRLLNLKKKELEREINNARRLVPQKADVEKELKNLSTQLKAARGRLFDLENQVETPDNLERWRALPGKDPSPEELSQKMDNLEITLAKQEEKLLEKELILEEVSRLSDRVRNEAQTGKEDTLNLAKKVNEYQSKIKEVTRKMMALVSELSMQQAQSLKLQQDKHQKELLLEGARARLEQGLPPMDECEQEWFKMERNRAMLAEQSNRHVMDDDEAQQVTTAELRPNAYIPDDDFPIPRPYGGKAPFKPSAQGANMRHIKKPQLKPLEL
eukprot:Nk52_evm35s370 gene=Nk52_evmTU35s370